MEEVITLRVTYNGETRDVLAAIDNPVGRLVMDACTQFGVPWHRMGLYTEDGARPAETDLLATTGIVDRQVLALRPLAVRGSSVGRYRSVK